MAALTAQIGHAKAATTPSRCGSTRTRHAPRSPSATPCHARPGPTASHPRRTPTDGSTSRGLLLSLRAETHDDGLREPLLPPAGVAGRGVVGPLDDRLRRPKRPTG